MIIKYSVKYGTRYQLNYDGEHNLIGVEVWERGYYATYRQVTLDFIKKEYEEYNGPGFDYYYNENEYKLSQFNYNDKMWYRFVEVPCHHLDCELDIHEDILKYLNHWYNDDKPDLCYFSIDGDTLQYDSASKSEKNTLYYHFRRRPDLAKLYNLITPGKKGFDCNKDSVFYLNAILSGDMTIGYKYGISNNRCDNRLYNQNRESVYNLVKVHSWNVSGKIARSIENIIKSKYTKEFSKEELPDGYTETFHVDAYDEVLNLINTIIEFTGVNEIQEEPEPEPEEPKYDTSTITSEIERVYNQIDNGKGYITNNEKNELVEIVIKSIDKDELKMVGVNYTDYINTNGTISSKKAADAFLKKFINYDRYKNNKILGIKNLQLRN